LEPKQNSGLAAYTLQPTSVYKAQSSNASIGIFFSFLAIGVVGAFAFFGTKAIRRRKAYNMTRAMELQMTASSRELRAHAADLL